MIPPKELRERRQWLNWTDDNGNKIPKQVNGQYGKSNDSKTWATYQSVKRVAGKFSGIAFVISDEDDFCGIDLDNCLDENGKMLDWAIPFIAKFSPVGYGEVSPSGRGIKFLVRGKKQEGSRCVHVVDADLKQQVEVYDKARFWTITGNLYAGCRSAGDGQAEVDWICEKFLLSPRDVAASPQPVHIPEPAVEPRYRPVTVERTELERRAQAYVEAVPATGANRNNTIFKLSGNLHALEHEGQRLSAGEIRSYCEHYNSQLLEPLEENELQKAIRSGMTNGTARATKPNDSRLVIDSPVDFSQLTFGDAEIPSSAQRSLNTDQHTIPLELIYNAPGLVGDLVRWFEKTCLYSVPELFFGSALAFMSFLTGRKIRDGLNGRTNMYILGTGLTGSGKDHARKAIKSLLIACEAPEHLAPEDIGSAAGLSKRMAEHPATLFQIDEFGAFLVQVANKMSPHLQAVESDLLKLYTSSGSSWKGRALADTERIPFVNQPHCVISGTCTPENLWNAMSTSQVHEGLLGRLQIFEAPRYVSLTDNVPLRIDRETPPQEIIDQVKWWLDYQPGGNLNTENPVPTLVDWTAEAEERLVGHMRNISEKRIHEDVISAAIWSRSAEKAGKLALIVAAAERRWVVTKDDADYAIALQNCLTRKLISRINLHIADNPMERAKKKLMNKLSHEWMTKTQLSRKTQWVKSSRERDEILLELLGAGLIQCREDLNTNPIQKSYRLVGG